MKLQPATGKLSSSLRPETEEITNLAVQVWKNTFKGVKVIKSVSLEQSQVICFLLFKVFVLSEAKRSKNVKLLLQITADCSYLC